MRIERGFLRSRVARRIVSLFVLCALVPILATAALSYDHVRKLLLDANGSDRSLFLACGIECAQGAMEFVL